jgi:hypothetical protein
MLLLLGIAAGGVWLQVINNDSMRATAATCGPPVVPAGTDPGQPPITHGQILANDALDQTPPAPPARAAVRVVNASPQRGQAAEVTEALRQLGFGQIAQPANDPLHPSLDLACRAQIRFGPRGAAAARTLSLVEPCAELIRDQRQDETVDLALGKKFDDLQPKVEARKVLVQLSEWAVQNPEQNQEQQGGQQAAQSTGPELDAAQLSAARQVNC